MKYWVNFYPWLENLEPYLSICIGKKTKTKYELINLALNNIYKYWQF